MQIIDEDLLAWIRCLPTCEFCGLRLRTGFEACHILGRGCGGGSRLDVPFGVAAGCPPVTGNACHRKQHDGILEIEIAIASVARRCKTTPEALLEALRFLRWVPSRPLAGIVGKRFAEITPKAQKLARPYVKEIL